MTIPLRKPSRSEMLGYVARFDKLVRADNALPDCSMPGFARTLMNIIGSERQRAKGELAPAGNSPPLVHHTAPFTMGFVEARPNNGVMMHNHDTHEVFMPIDSRWRVTWEGETGEESAVLDSFDVISIPPGVNRQFHCEIPRPGSEKGLLLAVVGGENPIVEFSEGAMKLMRAAGVVPPVPGKAGG